MDNRVIPSFNTLLKQRFPDLQVLRDFPLPNVKIRTPAIVTLTLTSRFERYTPKVVEKVENQSFMNVGEFMTSAKLHYFAKNIQGRYKFAEAIFDWFHQDQTEDRKISSNRIVPYGVKSWENANFAIKDFEHINDAYIIKSGEIRSVYDLIIDSPKIITLSSPLIKRTEIDDEISEGVEIASNL